MFKVLIVDDSSTARKVIAKALQLGNQDRVLEVSNGLDALKILERDSADLIITDLVMPQMNGLELISQVRQKHPAIPVIVVTAKGSEAIASAALREGASSYVPKSVMERDLSVIASRILAIVRGQRSRESLYGRIRQMETEIVLETDTTVIAPLVIQLLDVVKWMGVGDESDVNRVGVALDEALTNAIVHGNLEISSELREEADSHYYELVRRRCGEPPYQDRVLRVEVSMSPREAKFTIEDQGRGFDPNSLPDPTDPENLAKPCGRGVMLMRAFMDEVDFNARGNRVMMCKRRSTNGLPEASR